MNIVYELYDAVGAYLKRFRTYKDAHAYRMAMGRPDWAIKTKYKMNYE